MTEHLNVYFRGIRGGGNILSSKTSGDFIRNNCRLAISTVVIDDVSMSAFQITPARGYSINEVMSQINTNFIKNLAFSNNSITYDTFPSSNVSSISDLNGVVYNLRFSNNSILFDTFYSSNASLTDAEVTLLESAITGLSYDNNIFELNYDVVGEINVY